jgi:hypothetical protein
MNTWGRDTDARPAAHLARIIINLCVMVRRFAAKWHSCFIIFAHSLVDLRRTFISRYLSRTRCIAMMLYFYGDV